MAKHRFYAKTKGNTAAVLVAKDVAYSDSADYKAFITDGVLGEVGIFNATTRALIGSNTPLTEGEKYFLAQKTTAGVYHFTPFVFRKAEVTKTAYSAPVKQVATVTFTGTLGTEFKVGDTMSVKVIETTPGHEQFPTFTYDYMVKAGDSVTTIATALKNQINDPLNPRNRDLDWFIVATNAAGVLTLTARYFGSSFRVALPGKTYEVASNVYTTPFSYGSGFYDHVRDFEIEGDIFRGARTQYPDGGFSPDDFGVTDVFSDSTKTYDIYNINSLRSEKSPTPVNLHHHVYKMIFCIPTAGSLDLNFSTMLGFTAPV